MFYYILILCALLYQVAEFAQMLLLSGYRKYIPPQQKEA